jgi:hypothetical protein
LNVKKNVIATAITVFLILISINSYTYLFKPKNSLDLYQSISFADSFEEAQTFMLEGYEANFKKEDFEYMNRLDTDAKGISQFSLFEFDDKSYLILTSPGTQGFHKLKVLAVEELPEDIRDYFMELSH